MSEHVGSRHSTTTSSTNWSGYEFSGNSGASTNVYEAKASWSAPSVSEPSSYFCFFKHCDLSIWPGLEDTLGATNNHLAQAGIESGVYCTAGCSYFYNAWYDFLPAQSVNCLTVNSGDSITTTVTNNAKTGGASQNYLYNISVSDTTANQACTMTNNSYTDMTGPTYATFIGERPSFSGTPARLPQFSSFTMSGSTMYYGGASNSISTPYSNGWYNEDIMQNGGYTNINVGSVSSGAFTQTYSTSNGT